MTAAYLDGLPPAVRDLGPAMLMDLPANERLSCLTDGLCAFYDHVAGDVDDDDEPTDGPSGPDPDHPLILESAIAAEMNVALEGWLGVTVPIETLLLDGLSLRGLAARLLVELEAGGQVVATSGPALRVDPGRRHDPFALSDIQQAYWIGRDPVYELGDVSAALFVELTVSEFDLDRARHALARVIERHGMLRSVVGRGGTQQVLPTIAAPQIDVRDLRDLDRAQRSSAMAAHREQLARRRTTPERPEPFAIRFLQLEPMRSCLMMSVDMVKLDAWSVQLLLAEWFQLYDHPDTALAPLELTFRDYVRWTEEVRGSAAFDSARNYWLQRLPTLPPAPELPLVTTLAAVSHPTFSARSVRVPRDRWIALKERAASEGLTPSMVLCAAYAEVLAAWSRHRRFTVSVAGGRPPAHPDLPRVLGPFARPSLLEIDLTGEGGFRDRARAVQRTFSRDLEHREFSGVDVLREIAATQGRTRASMPVIFTSVLPQAGEGGLPRPSWLAADPYVVWGMPQLLLENQMIEVDGDLLITWVSVDQVFAEGVVDDMFTAYQDLLDRVVDDDDLWSVAGPELLPPAHAHRRGRVNATSAPVPDGLVHDPFAAQAAVQPDAPAVISARRELTYAELDRQADHVARELVDRGVAPGELVGICMERGWEQVAAVLGVLRAGAAYLPLDPGLPLRRLHHLLDRGQVAVALVQPAVVGRHDWPSTVDCQVVEYTDRDVAGRVDVRVRPDDLAYVIFTSGSTGDPKGVMIEHRSVLNTVLDVNRRFGIGTDDRVLAVSSLSFDLSVHDVFGVLAAGGAIVLPEPGAAADPGHWWDLIERERVTVWNSVPALMQLLVAHGARPDVGPVRGGPRCVLLSGDWIPVGLPAAVRRTFPGAEVISLGGATEASIWSVFHPVVDADGDRRSIPYGRPLTNQRLYVLDDRLEPRPDLVAGDLYIAGDGVARGYWRDPERTASAFVTHPRTGERLYRTGDLGRWLPSADIEFLGREDAQVKINGYRVELGEVESTLEQHPAVRSAVASVLGDPVSGRALVAEVVLTEEPATPEELTAFVAERLPGYAVPGRIGVVDSLRLTANGKLDRTAIARSEAPAIGRADPVEVTPTAHVLARILGELLDREVGVHDDVYACGANSLVAVQLVARAQDVGIELVAADVLTNPTAAALAATARPASTVLVAEG